MIACQVCGGELGAEARNGLRTCGDCGTLHVVDSNEREWYIVTENNDSHGRVELLEKVRRITEQIESVKLSKKTSNKAYNDEIKDLEAERRDVIDTLKGTIDK